MSSYHVRVGGKVYGPFTGEQLQQAAAAGRITGTAEISTDRPGQPHAWLPAAQVLGPGSLRGGQPVGAAPNAVAGSVVATGGTQKYLESLRNRTRYPFYRTAILICAILGYVAAFMPIGLIVFKVVWTGLSSISPYEVIGAVFAAAFIGVLVTVSREMFSMYADFVDSTLDHHSRSS